MIELGITNGALLQVQRGSPLEEGVYTIKLALVRLLAETEVGSSGVGAPAPRDGSEKSKEERLFAKKCLGELEVKGTMTVEEMRTAAYSKFIEGKDLGPNYKIEAASQMKLRLSKNDDLGEILKDPTDPLDKFFLYDGLEFLLQKPDPAAFVAMAEPGDCYTVIVKEWRGDTWEFGKTYEVEVPKLMKCSDLALELGKVYPHIPVNTMFGCRVNLYKPLIRSDLTLKRWHSLAPQKVWVGSSQLEVVRDSIFIVIRDQSVPIRQLSIEEDTEMVSKWASNTYIEHILRKDQSGA
mmetsp:Transcript_33433/g.51321  ORF Transcript_33433/g.51321 Transcript_33433/m.51321 type:complete len:294 (-) Transcript_33433:258-1139(-)